MRDRTLLAILLVLAPSIVLGCGKSDSPATPLRQGAPPAATPTLEAPLEEEVVDENPAAGDDPAIPPPSMAAEVMRGHFEEANNAREAMIRADLDKAKVAMAWLAGHDLGVALPEELAPLQANMQAAAKEFGKADSLQDAGVALASTLARCGHCHMAAGKGPEIATNPAPNTKDLNSHMQRHHWAVRELWSGLVTASEETFRSGIEGLKEAPLNAKQMAAAPSQRAQVEELDKHVHALGDKLRRAKTEAERIEGYGHLLATCATCHRLMARGPQPTGTFE